MASTRPARMSAGMSQEALSAGAVETASTLDDGTTLASAKPPPSYPFHDFSPPSTRPTSSYPFPDLPSFSARRPYYAPSDHPTPTLSQTPRPKTAAPRPKRGSKPPVAFRTRSSSSLLDEFFRHPERRTVWQDTGGLVRRRQDSDMDRQAVGDLVDFLRNHAPPPENFMSIADERDADDRGRWLKLKPFANRRSRSAPKRPTPLRLPDTAVAGRTIGGHRHIAISIPIEHSPFGLNPKSQYPVYTKDGEYHTEPEPVMRYTDSNGVVTVLRTVTESQESPVTHAFSGQPRKFCRPISVTVEPLRPPVSRSLSFGEARGGHTRDYSTATLPPTPLCHSKSCHLGSTREGRGHGNAHHGVRRDVQPIILGPHCGDTPTSSTTHSNPAHRRPISRRWSAFPPVGYGPAESIDGVMYGQRRPHAKPCDTQPSIARAETYSGRARSGTGASNYSDKTATDVNVAKVVPMIRVNSNRKSMVDLRHTSVAQQETKVGKPLESPTLSARSSDSRKSRKEKVREKRMKDIEASRATRERRKAESDAGSLRRSSSIAPSELSFKKSDNESEPADLVPPANPPTRRPSLTPVIVVANVEPSSLSISPASYHTPPSAPASSTQTLFSALSTPSHTPRGRSPVRSLQDRTSVSQHGEHRQAYSLRTRSSACPARAVPLSPARVAYEERMLEMEQRVRRLESSDDIWLNSMVPVLDNLNRTLVMIQDGRRFMEDGEEAQVGKVPPTLPAALRKLARRRTLNENMLDENMLLDLKRVEDGEHEDGIKPGGLESVMRELQVTSQEWCPTREEIEMMREQQTGVAL